MTEDNDTSYSSYEEDDAAAKKGGPNVRLTVDMARQIVANVLERRDMPRKRKSDEDEIDALVDDLDDELEDEEDVEEEEEEIEDVEEEEEEEEDEDPDEAPKRTRKGRKAKTAKKKAAPEKVGVGTVEVAEAAGIEPRQLRMYLRDKGIQANDSREGRYNWPSLESKEVKRIISDIRKGAVDRLNKEKLANLKGRKKKSTTKKTTAKKRVKVRSQKK